MNITIREMAKAKHIAVNYPEIQAELRDLSIEEEILFVDFFNSHCADYKDYFSEVIKGLKNGVLISLLTKKEEDTQISEYSDQELLLVKALRMNHDIGDFLQVSAAINRAQLRSWYPEMMKSVDEMNNKDKYLFLKVYENWLTRSKKENEHINLIIEHLKSGLLMSAITKIVVNKCGVAELSQDEVHFVLDHSEPYTYIYRNMPEEYVQALHDRSQPLEK